jgi:hypothetical protein
MAVPVSYYEYNISNGQNIVSNIYYAIFNNIYWTLFSAHCLCYIHIDTTLVPLSFNFKGKRTC